MEHHTPVEVKERAPLQAKINQLTTKLVQTKTVLDQTRELLKSAEQENNKLKEALQDSLSSKKNQLSVLGKVIGQLKEVTDKVKFQSPIVKRES